MLSGGMRSVFTSGLDGFCVVPTPEPPALTFQ